MARSARRATIFNCKIIYGIPRPLELIDLPLDLSVALFGFERGSHRSVVVPQTFDEILVFRTQCFGFRQPPVGQLDVSGSHHLLKSFIYGDGFSSPVQPFVKARNKNKKYKKEK